LVLMLLKASIDLLGVGVGGRRSVSWWGLMFRGSQAQLVTVTGCGGVKRGAIVVPQSWEALVAQSTVPAVPPWPS
jgi:hypothetical protein